MVDEIDTNAVPENAEADAPVIAAEPKKARAKRRTPAELAAAAAAKSKKSNSRKKATLTDERKPTIANEIASTKPASKDSAKSSAVGRPAVAQMAAAAADEFTYLLQLEQENKVLRKSLAEKLRAENVDLRKRLGQA